MRLLSTEGPNTITIRASVFHHLSVFFSCFGLLRLEFFSILINAFCGPGNEKKKIPGQLPGTRREDVGGKRGGGHISLGHVVISYVKRNRVKCPTD